MHENAVYPHFLQSITLYRSLHQALPFKASKTSFLRKILLEVYSECNAYNISNKIFFEENVA